MKERLNSHERGLEIVEEEMSLTFSSCFEKHFHVLTIAISTSSMCFMCLYVCSKVSLKLARNIFYYVECVELDRQTDGRVHVGFLEKE